MRVDLPHRAALWKLNVGEQLEEGDSEGEHVRRGAVRHRGRRGCRGRAAACLAQNTGHKFRLILDPFRMIFLRIFL